MGNDSRIDKAARFETSVLGARPRKIARSRRSEIWRGVCLRLHAMRFQRRNQTASEPSMAFISEGSEVVGTCSFNGSVVVSGRVKGEIHASGTLTIGRAGHVEARLQAPVVIVEGEVVGSIVATERIELREKAHVSGDLETPALIIEESAVFEGQTKRVRANRNGAGGDTRPVVTGEFATA
jgi:cytoskeletal protein CcmA (bactofilin family)